MKLRWHVLVSDLNHKLRIPSKTPVTYNKPASTFLSSVSQEAKVLVFLLVLKLVGFSADYDAESLL